MDTSALRRAPEFFEQNGATNTIREILHQPRLWRELAGYLADNRAKIADFMESVMPIKGLRIVFTGAGSSAFIGESLQGILRAENGIRCETLHTTDIVAAPDCVLEDVPTLLISYSRSGESPESVGAIKYAEKRITELYNIVIVCKKDSSLANYAEQAAKTLVLDMPPESSDLGFAMTSSVSCMALATWCVFDWKNMAARLDYVNRLADLVEAQFANIDEIALQIAKKNYDRVVYLGSGKLRGLARESAVKSLELTNGKVVSIYDTPTGFRHGPKTVVNDTTLSVHYISPDAFTARYDMDFLNEMLAEKKGNLVAAIIPNHLAAPKDCDAVYSYTIPTPHDYESICAYIMGLMFTQLLSVEKSMLLGMKTDTPCAGGEVNRVVKGVVVYEL